MFNTLIELGKKLSEGQGEWDDFIYCPKYELETKKGVPIKNYKLEIILDLDEQRIVCGKEQLSEFDPEKDWKEFMCLDTLKGNNKAIYNSVEKKNFINLEKTFFGVDKKGNAPEQGQLDEAIVKDFPDLVGEGLQGLLQEIFTLKSAFRKFFTFKDKKDNEKFGLDDLINSLNFNKVTDRLLMLYVSVRRSGSAIAFAKNEMYLDFLRLKFISKNEISDSREDRDRLCYASGYKRENVGTASFQRGYNLNAPFVKTTLNFTSEFDKNNLSKNYQIGAEEQKLLDKASLHLTKNYQVKIAGNYHCVVPHFRNNESVVEELKFEKLAKASELLFHSSKTQKGKSLEDIMTNLLDEHDDVFWVDYLGFESDGNFFKIVNSIKDISSNYFFHVIKSFSDVDFEIKRISGLNWNSKYDFNFYQLYRIIPQREGKQKISESLLLFKDIMEQRKIKNERLYKYFRELVLCHRYKRYKGYPNIRQEEVFDYALQNAVKSYSALFLVLRKLNLINQMEENNNLTTMPKESDKSKEYWGAVMEYFEKMNFTDSQQALFYLGRALNTIAYAQSSKGHNSKPILNKLNYNGMNRDKILRLSIDLAEKIKQYSVFQTEGNLSKFHQLFNANSWSMNPEEALFYILSGYSFFIANSNKSENK